MKSNPEAIVFLTPGFPKDESETNCLPAVQDFIRTFQEQFTNIEVKVIAFQYPPTRKKFYWHEIEIFSCGYRKNNSFNHFISWFQALRIFSSLQKQYAISIICSFWLTECSLVAQWLSRFKGVKVYAWTMGQDALPSNKYLHFLNKNHLRIISISENLSEQLHKRKSFYADQIIPLGVRDSKFLLLKNTERTIDIIGIGSLIPLKNFTLFIEVVHQLIVDFPKLSCAIIGDGPEKKLIERNIHSSGLQNHVHLIGSISHEEVFHWLKKSKILLHTSGYEGQGLVMTEALVCGCYVLCKDVGRLQSPQKMFVCKTTEEMIERIKILLKGDLFFAPVILQTMKNTVQQFAEFSGIENS